MTQQRLSLIPLIPRFAELQRIETTETVAEDRIRL